MAQPQWITSSGSLGTIPEGTFYQLPLFAEDPDGGNVYFRVIAGELPDGIQVRKNGLIEGIPKAITSVQGVPTEVARDITSKFAVRAYTEKTINGSKVIDRLADRTFTITVTGQDFPDFLTPPGNIGTFYDGTEVAIQIEFTDTDPNDKVQCRLFNGELPPGLVLDKRTGLISGIIRPTSVLPVSATVGYSATAFDEYPYAFTAQYINKNYQFTLELTDGKDSNTRTFEIFVNTRKDQTADTTSITADSTKVTADATNTYVPILLTPQGDLGRVRSDNFYAYQFKAIDFDYDPVEFLLTVGSGIGFDADGTVYDEENQGFDRGAFSLPPGLQLDPGTGWFYGYIPDLGTTEQTYRFAVRVKKVSTAPTYNASVAYTAQSVVMFAGSTYEAMIDVPAGIPPTNVNYWFQLQEVISPFYYFTMTIIGNIETEVKWVTEPNLGTINNGAISTLSVEAYNVGGRSLVYRLAPNTDSRLPQGLKLLPSGHIVGKVSFNTFALDGGTTTFDKDLNTRLGIDATTFDMEFNFTVNAYSPQAENPGYQLGAIQMANGGSGYGVVNVTFSAPSAPGGVTATGIVTVTDGKVTGVTITNRGFGYTTTPTVTFDMPVVGLDQAQGVVVLSGDRVSQVVITNDGSGYETPKVVISAPPSVIDAIQATAGEITTVNGVITNIAVGNPGRGYQNPPTITIIGTGSGAIARPQMEIINVVNAVSTYRRFTITVNREFNQPYNRLYIKAMPPFEDRALINQLIFNQDVIPEQSVYRADDPNFGVAKCVVYDHAYGLRDDTLNAYANSLLINHYWKNLVLGEIQLAQAIDPTTNKVLYEVIYSRIIDDQVNSAGQSVSKEVTLPYPITEDDSTEIDKVYPNSLINMRDQVIDVVGQISPALPLWMTSKQTNGRVLGFTPAWVIAYIKPGQGSRVLYNIQQMFGEQLNKIDFKADRYELDRSQTHNWDPETDQWIPSPPEATTFDNTTTIFDLNSVRFIAPSDQYLTVPDTYDKYLLYPRTNILG